jgi:superfamily II DNA or RNA helicase
MNSIMILSRINSPSLALQVLGRAMRGEKNGGNLKNTIFLTKDNEVTLTNFNILEQRVLNPS